MESNKGHAPSHLDLRPNGAMDRDRRTVVLLREEWTFQSARLARPLGVRGPARRPARPLTAKILLYIPCRAGPPQALPLLSFPNFWTGPRMPLVRRSLISSGPKP